MNIFLNSFYYQRQRLKLSLITFLFCFNTSLNAAPQRNTNTTEQTAAAIQQMRVTLDNVKYTVNNHETEMRMFDEKLQNLDVIIENVRDHLADSSKSHKDQLKGYSSSLESQLSSLENTTKGIVADLKQFKTYTTESTVILSQYRQKIESLEKTIDQQNKTIDQLQAAMEALVDVVHIKESISISPKDNPVAKNSFDQLKNSSERSYRIKAGDSLEKIARQNNTSVQAIKALNNMNTDRIVVGKTILLPD